jgi:hypothetical protein
MPQASGNTLTGTITGTGRTDWLVMTDGDLQINFGTATVTVDVSNDNGGSWTTLKLPDMTSDASFTADVYMALGPFPRPVAISLNCSSYTSSTSYVLRKTNG